MFEPVHTVTDYYDGPRRGIADLDGRPHLYDAEWSSEIDNYAETFLLTPVDGNVLALALEDWAIWRRWEDAFHSGLVDHDSHPALPEDRARHEELVALLAPQLVTVPERAVRKRADFRVRADVPDPIPGVMRQLEVRWYDPA